MEQTGWEVPDLVTEEETVVVPQHLQFDREELCHCVRILRVGVDLLPALFCQILKESTGCSIMGMRGWTFRGNRASDGLSA